MCTQDKKSRLLLRARVVETIYPFSMRNHITIDSRVYAKKQEPFSWYFWSKILLAFSFDNDSPVSGEK